MRPVGQDWVGSGCVETTDPGRGLVVAYQIQPEERQTLESVPSPAGPAWMGQVGNRSAGYQRGTQNGLSVTTESKGLARGVNSLPGLFRDGV